MFGVQDIAQSERRDLLYFLLVWGCPLPAGSERKNIPERMMEPNKGNRLITTGIIGSITAVICCFTPALVVLLSALGLAAVIGYLDYVLLPAMAILLGLIVYGWWIKSRCPAESKTSDIKKAENHPPAGLPNKKWLPGSPTSRLSDFDIPGLVGKLRRRA
jgi:mercuric ion transport protein